MKFLLRFFIYTVSFAFLLFGRSLFGSSLCKALIREMIIINMTNENGRAAMMIVFCSAVNPFTDSKMTAIDDWMTPQIIFTLFGGVNEPYVDCMPNTKVAESAEVMKNDAIRIIATTEIKNDKGIALNISKIVSSVLAFAKSAIPSRCILIAVVPKVVNQMAPRSVGANRTPIINSRIVLPFDTRAMNMLTNGAQEIHQAQ